MRAGLLVVIALSGCVYRRSVVPAQLAPLRDARHPEALVLRTEDGRRVRLGAGSEVRLCSASGCSDWLDAGDLTVDDRGVYHGRAGWAWADLARVEVSTVGGDRTLAALAGTTAVVAVVAAVAIVAIVVASLPRDEPAGDGDGDLGLDAASAVIGAIWSRPEDEPGTWKPALEAGADTAPAFGRRARRRAAIRVLVAADTLVTRARDHVESLTVGLRLGELLEVGAVVRHVGAGATTRLGAVGVYLGGHFALDAAHRVAIPLGFDVVRDDGETHARLRWGLRARVWRDVFAGVAPWNPTYVGGRWLYPSGVEVGVAF